MINDQIFIYVTNNDDGNIGMCSNNVKTIYRVPFTRKGKKYIRYHNKNILLRHTDHYYYINGWKIMEKPLRKFYD